MLITSEIYGCAYTVAIGLTIRLAQGLGLHCSPNPDKVTDSKGRDEALVKYFIW